MVNSTRETNSHLHCRVERNNAQMKCIAKKHNNMTWPGSTQDLVIQSTAC